MSDATVILRTVPLGTRRKEPDSDPEVLRLVEEWRLARRAGDREGARKIAAKVDKARQKAGRARR